MSVRRVKLNSVIHILKHAFFTFKDNPVKWRYWITALLLFILDEAIFPGSGVLNNTLLDAIPTILAIYLFVSTIILILETPIKLIKGQIRISLRVPHAHTLFTLLLAVLLVYTMYSNYQFSTQLTLVENKLGGINKLSCNEQDTINKVRQSVVRIIGGDSEGSGFVFQSNGEILTNFHVIQFEPAPKVILPDNSFETAQIVMADKNADLAVLRIDRLLPVIQWGKSKDLSPAEELLAIGFPFGGDLSGESSVNKGYLAGRRTFPDTGVEYIQTDATLNPGVSGGPMVNICGVVEGINTEGTGGLGLAISSESIQQKLNEMSRSKDSLKDIQKITFQPNKSPVDAVTAFYNYLKIRQLDKAWGLLSDNFRKGYSINQWASGYASLLDTSAIKVEADPSVANRVDVKLTTKDLVGDQIVYKYFEGYWDVKKVGDTFLLWQANIKEVTDPDYLWFLD